jgi:hypothetical protein
MTSHIAYRGVIEQLGIEHVRIDSDWTGIHSTALCV